MTNGANGSGVHVKLSFLADPSRIEIFEVPNHIPKDANMNTFQLWAEGKGCKFHTWEVSDADLAAQDLTDEEFSKAVNKTFDDLCVTPVHGGQAFVPIGQLTRFAVRHLRNNGEMFDARREKVWQWILRNPDKFTLGTGRHENRDRIFRINSLLPG